MRSGLFDYLRNPAFLRAWLSHVRRGWTPRQLLAYSLRRGLAFTPGTGYAYVNTNTVLLGLVVQKVSHQPVAVYIKRHIPRAPAPHAHQPPDRCGVPVPPRAGLHQPFARVHAG
jgi:CubicO group peptidase (beta-lactamase class C family)